MLGFLKKTIQISFLVIALFSITNIVLAQETPAFNLNVSPLHPRAGESVTLTVSSDIIDLDSSKIVWYIDGVARKSTTNKSVIIKTNSSGQSTSVRVVVETSDGVIKEESREISPSGIDLVIEPISYTMPFYKGKPYLIGQGTVKVIAMPDIVVNGTKVPSKDLTFKWTRGENVLGSSSGKGKNSVVLTSTIPVRDITIGVEVFDDAGTSLAQTSKVIILSDPKILFYENSPLYGILYNRAVMGSYFLGTREELKIVAKPFSFSFSKDTAPEAKYSWYVNKNYIVPDEKTNELLLKQTSTNLKGTASIMLNLKHNDKINQYVSGGFNVDFGE